MLGEVSLVELAGDKNGPGHAVERELIKKAHDFAKKELSRPEGGNKTGRVEHSVRVAATLAGLGLDNTTVVAALLHHTRLHANTDVEKIESEFGKEVATIVEEHRKIKEIEDKNTSKISTQLLSQVMLATAKDIRAIFLAIASRLDVLQNPPKIEKRELRQKVEAGLSIYAPICHKLGLYGLKGELEDSRLKLLKPGVFKKISDLVGKTREQREALAAEAVEEFRGLMKKEKKGVTVEGRAKHFYAIYKKIAEQARKFSEIYDLLGIRLVCGSIKECYEVLGVLHSKYEILPGKFTDYIANPKENGYRSIHTVLKWRGMPLEAQIRTWEMHYENETGLAAHWQYKHYAEDRHFDKKLSWAKQLIEWQRKGGGRISLKLDFGENKIFAFTPKNEVVILPEKATPIDFAFAVHSDLGRKCGKAKVNGKMVSLGSALENADVVEIIPAKGLQVKRQWLSIVKSSKANAKIRQALGIKTVKKAMEKIMREATTADKAVRIARCCNPLPGDEIVGLRTTKRKISIHRKECGNAQGKTRGNVVSVGWDLAKKDYLVEIRVHAKESPGLLPTILGIFDEAKVAINSTNAKSNPNGTANCVFNARIRNLDQLETVIGKVGRLPGVFRVERA